MTDAVRDVHIETGVGMAFAAGSAVWSFDADLWGTCAQGLHVDQAVEAFTAEHGPVRTVETIHGDEQAFTRDRLPASDDELAITLDILANQRARALSLLAQAPPELLNLDQSHRRLPEWATWRSIGDMFWHICDTESRYYLPRCGLPSRNRATTLEQELTESANHVQMVLASMPRDIDAFVGTEEWTSTKLLRRLAWHEAGELDVIEDLLRQ